MLLIKTDLAHQVLQDRSVSLNQRLRAALIMFDGKHQTAFVLKMTASFGVTQGDVDELVSLGMLKESGLPGGTLAPNTKPVADERSPQQRYQDAYPLATKITASLGLRGFRLNLAVEAATSYEALLALAPKIRDAVGPEKFAALGKALSG
jgi:hypothetical protein